jgi:hypothetical protein
VIKLGDGSEWGTAAEIAQRLGPGVSRAMIRFWVRDRRLTKVVVGPREVRYSVAEVSAVEAEVRRSGRGRGRPC